jgi:hypothetical protein
MHSRTVRTTGLIVALAITTAGCARWVETTDIGAFRLSEHHVYYTLNTFIEKTTLCSVTRDFCLEERGLAVWPHPPDATPPFIVVTGLDKPYLAHFLDTTTGAEVVCRDCDMPMQHLIDKSWGPAWSAKGDRAALASAPAAGSPWLFVLQFDPNQVSATRLTGAGVTTHPRDPEFSPSGDVLAWYSCAAKCTLWWYRISSRTFAQHATPCSYTSDLEITWDNDTPRAQFSSGLRQVDHEAPRDLCGGDR